MVVVWGDNEAGLCGLEDRDGEVAGMRNVVHSDIEPNDPGKELEACLKFRRTLRLLQVLLLDVLPVKELVKVDVRILVVGFVHVRCGSRLGILSLGHVEMVLRPVCRVLRYGAVWHSDVSGRTNTWSNSVATAFAIWVFGVLVYNYEHGGRIGSPVNLAILFVCDERLFDMHSVDGSVAAGESSGDGLDVNSFEGIGGAIDVEIELEIDDVVMHSAGKSVVDSVSELLIAAGICAFDVAGGTDSDLDTTVIEKLVFNNVVVIANGRNGT